MELRQQLKVLSINPVHVPAGPRYLEGEAERGYTHSFPRVSVRVCEGGRGGYTTVSSRMVRDRTPRVRRTDVTPALDFAGYAGDLLILQRILWAASWMRGGRSDWYGWIRLGLGRRKGAPGAGGWGDRSEDMGVVIQSMGRAGIEIEDWLLSGKLQREDRVL